MRTTLSISIVLNCGLLGCVALLLLNGQQAEQQIKAPATADGPPSATATARPTAVVAPTPEVKAFHWSQIESADYRTYVANLRGVGCPEQTIRDIIVADVKALYASRRQPLEQQLATSNGTSGMAAQRELQELSKQEAPMIAALLAPPPSAASPGTRLESGAPVSGFLRQASPNVVSLPLAFQEVAPSPELKLNSEQTRIVNDLRERFIAEVGGPNQDPSDPAYLERWQATQPAVDLDLRGMLGINAFQSYQIAAWAKAHEPAPSEP